jgi:hypothetical protein
MGTSRTGAELAGKIDKLAKDLKDVRVPLEATALRGKQIFQASAASSGALGNTITGKRKAIGVKYDIAKASKAAGTATAIITYTGPAHLINNPTRPHVIAARRLGLSRRRSTSRAARERDVTLAFGGSAAGMFGALKAATRTTRSGAVRSQGAQALTIGTSLRAYARHPGTHGKGFFQRARTVAEATLPTVYARAQITEPLKRIF